MIGEIKDSPCIHLAENGECVSREGWCVAWGYWDHSERLDGQDAEDFCKMPQNKRTRFDPNTCQCHDGNGNTLNKCNECPR